MTTRRRSRQQQYKNENSGVTLEAKTENQRNYIRAIVENEVIFCTGPSGCGKSYIAAGIAAMHLLEGRCEEIVVSRPLVCCGSKLGALPGDVAEKTDPYLLPIKSHLIKFLGRQRFGEKMMNGQIRFEVLELMRGTTYDHAYMILDEAQNCTFEQIKMFVTRMGTDSKAIINGDTRQTDLKNSHDLADFVDRVSHIHGIEVCSLGVSDIQRNHIVGRIIAELES